MKGLFERSHSIESTHYLPRRICPASCAPCFSFSLHPEINLWISRRALRDEDFVPRFSRRHRISALSCGPLWLERWRSVVRRPVMEFLSTIYFDHLHCHPWYEPCYSIADWFHRFEVLSVFGEIAHPRPGDEGAGVDREQVETVYNLLFLVEDENGISSVICFVSTRTYTYK